MNLVTNSKLTTQLYDKRDDFTSTIANVLFYVAKSKFHLHMDLISRSWLDIECKSLFDIRWVFDSRQSTDKHVYVPGVFTVSFRRLSANSMVVTMMYLYSTFFPDQMMFDVFQTSLSCSWHTGHKLRFEPELQLGVTAGVTVRQGMLTPPRHLILPPIYAEVHIRPIFGFVFPTGFMRLINALYLCYFNLTPGWGVCWWTLSPQGSLQAH
jgi:hypothetical protein